MVEGHENRLGFMGELVAAEGGPSVFDGVDRNALEGTGLQICLEGSVLMKRPSSPLRVTRYFISSAWLLGR